MKPSEVACVIGVHRGERVALEAAPEGEYWRVQGRRIYLHRSEVVLLEGAPEAVAVPVATLRWASWAMPR
ncbi:MAG: hypothetical protein HZA54_05245 [Planctomycetes bacterium]|nr:hypothetical protein [Planctomycetota bacterium]